MRPQQSLVSAVRRVALEGLEGRRLCSTTAWISNGNLVVEGDANANVITITNANGLTHVNGQAFADFLIPKGIVVYPDVSPKNSSAADRVDVQTTAKSVDVYAGTAGPLNDAKLEVTVGRYGDTAGVTGTVRVHGNGETRLTVDDGRTSAATKVAVSYVPNGSFSMIRGATPVAVLFDGATFGGVAVKLGSGNDVVSVDGTSPALNRTHNLVPLTIDAGLGVNFVDVNATSAATALRVDNTRGGHDSVNVGHDTVAKVQGPILVANTTGKSTIFIDDDVDKAADQSWHLQSGLVTFQRDGVAALGVTFDPAKVDRLGVSVSTAAATIDVFDTLRPSAGNTADTNLFVGGQGKWINVLGTTGPLNVKYGSNNVIYLGNKHTTADIRGDVTFDDQYSDDAITIDNSQSTVGQSVVLSPGPRKGLSAITGIAPATIRYGGARSLSLHTSAAADSVRILGTTLHTFTYVDAGGGPDVIVVGNYINSLDNLAGTLQVDGGDGPNTLYLLDSGAVGTHSYLQSPGFFQRQGVAAILFQDIYRFIVKK